MPTLSAPLHKACDVRRYSGGGNKVDGSSSPSFYINLVRCPSASSPKLLPTTPPHHRPRVLPQVAGALPSSCTSCRTSKLTPYQGLQAQTTHALKTVGRGMPELLCCSSVRAAQDCSGGCWAAGLAVGTGLAGHLRGVAGTVRSDSHGSRVGFGHRCHSRGARRHVRASGSTGVSRRPIQK